MIQSRFAVVALGVCALGVKMIFADVAHALPPTEKIEMTQARIEVAGKYNAFALSANHGKTAHIFSSEGKSHFDKFEIADFSSGDRFKTFQKKIILSSPDLSYRDAGGGQGPDGYFYLFSVAYGQSKAGDYSKFKKYQVHRTRDFEKWELAATDLPLNNGLDGVAYGKLQVLPSGLMLQTVYGFNKVFCIESKDGRNWTVRSEISSGPTILNETCMQVVSGASDANTVIVAMSRGESELNMFLSKDGALTWRNCGSVYGSSPHAVSPWLEKLPNGDIAFLWADRSFNVIRSFEYSAQVLSSSPDFAGISKTALLRKKVLYESVLNSKDYVPNVGAHFGYPSTLWQDGTLYVVSNDLHPQQKPPYTGIDAVQVDLIFQKYEGTVKLKAFSNAAQNFPNDAATQIAFSDAALDNSGALHDNDIVIPKDGFYAFGGAWQLGNAGGGRRILEFYVYDAGEPKNQQRRKLVFQKELSAGLAAAKQTLDGNTTYYFRKGEVLRAFIAVYGASEPVQSNAPQQLGGPGAGIYAGAYLYEIP